MDKLLELEWNSVEWVTSLAPNLASPTVSGKPTLMAVLTARAPRASTKAPPILDGSSEATLTLDGKTGCSGSSSSSSCLEMSREPMASTDVHPTLAGVAVWKARAPKRWLETATARLALHKEMVKRTGPCDPLPPWSGLVADREPCTDVKTGPDSPLPRIEATSFHRRRNQRLVPRLAVLFGTKKKRVIAK